MEETLQPLAAASPIIEFYDVRGVENL